MKFYISFGQIHIHLINGHAIDKDCLVELEAGSRLEARMRTMVWFKGIYHNVYDKLPDMSFFPRGVIKL